MSVVTISQLLENGVHFGHPTRRWNPKMKRFILADRSGIYVIDMRQTVSRLKEAEQFVTDTVARGGEILFVGTKKQAQQPIVEQASRVGQPYVSHRWLGGLLTNFATVSKRLTRMNELEELDLEGSDSGYTKKELLIRRRELAKLQRSLGGIRNMSRVPAALWVVDTNREHLAIEEANKLGIPVIAVLDTNCDPDRVQYPVPGNDDSIRSVEFLTRIVADAAAAGLIRRHQKEEQSSEPLAEWERELLERETGILEAGLAEDKDKKLETKSEGAK